VVHIHIHNMWPEVISLFLKISQ